MKCVSDMLSKLKEPREAVVIYNGQSLCLQCLFARYATDFDQKYIEELLKND